MSKKCENCGLPEGALINPGVDIEIKHHAENRFKRESNITVWCCTEECAVQTKARAKYGESSHKWPISLAKFAGIEKSAATRLAKS